MSMNNLPTIIQRSFREPGSRIGGFTLSLTLMKAITYLTHL